MTEAKKFEKALTQAVAGEVYFDDCMRGVYATDASLYQMVPQCVVVPRDEADVLAALRVAYEHRVPTTVRGGATSLSGQTFGPGMVLDVSKYLDRVLEVDPSGQWARVQPGVVRDQLNKQVAPLGTHFAPDPATGSRATVGGMVGNNTCGTRSVVFGKTIDHVLSCRVALADGTVLEFDELDADGWRERAGGAGAGDPQARLYSELEQVIEANRDEILARYPKVLRRVSGYNLDDFVEGAGYTGSIGPRAERNRGHRPWNLTSLVVGSEGTLCVLLEARVRLVPVPRATALVVVHFDDFREALEHVDAMLQHDPSTVELLDRTVMDEAKRNPATRQMSYFIDGTPDAVQIVEFFGEDAVEARARADRFVADMQAQGIGYAWPLFADAVGQRDVWETRKLGLGLISNVKGANKGRDFIEDACVPTQYLAEYITRIRDLCEDNGIDRVSLYAHASVGVVHVVPALDLHDRHAVETMQRIADTAFDWVMQYGGSWSGEHGDGQLRGQYLPRMFGPQLYEAFRQVKAAFDPLNLMNPGKVVDSPRLTEYLRYQVPGYEQNCQRAAAAAHYRYQQQGGLPLAVEQCNGVGACRKTGSGTMCPSYMATRDEQHTTRGRANALRLAMSGQLGSDPVAALASDGVDSVLSLCLECKACKTECPNAVDMAKLKSEVLQLRHDHHGTPLGAKILGRMPDAARRLAGRAARFGSLADLVPGGRRVLEKVAGIDRRRPLPSFARRTLSQRLQAAPVRAGARDRGRVVLFDDTYVNFFEPHLGLAAIDLLEQSGFEVVLAGAGCCQRTRMSKGLVREARQLGGETIAKLAPYARAGLPILCLEPSCASALMDDLPDLVEDREAAAAVAEQVRMLDQFLADQDVPLEADAQQILLHGHCHQKALFGTQKLVKLLGGIAGIECAEVDSGCCGMAGSFGYENYELSGKIGEDRLFPAVRQAVATGTTVVAPGISCRHQLHDFLGVRAYHWLELVRAKSQRG